MKKIAILGTFAAVVLSSCGAGAGTPKSESDSLAYAMGVDFGLYAKKIDSTLDVNVVAAGIRAAMKGDTSVMGQEQAFAFMREYFQVRMPLKEKKASEQFLADVEKNNANVKKSATGLLYEIVTPGDAQKITVADTLRVVYEGKLKDGNVFAPQDTASFPLQGMLPGWIEGLQLVGKGGELNLWIPSNLAYGERGAGQVIGPNQALQFHVKVLDVMPGDTAKLNQPVKGKLNLNQPNKTANKAQ